MQPQAMGTVMPTQHMASDKDWIVTLVLSILVGTLVSTDFTPETSFWAFQTHHVWRLGAVVAHRSHHARHRKLPRR